MIPVQNVSFQESKWFLKGNLLAGRCLPIPNVWGRFATTATGKLSFMSADWIGFWTRGCDSMRISQTIEIPNQKAGFISWDDLQTWNHPHSITASCPFHWRLENSWDKHQLSTFKLPRLVKVAGKKGTMFSMFETNTQVETTQLLFTSFVCPTWTFGGAQPDSAARWWKSWCKRVLISMSKMRWKSWPLTGNFPPLLPFFLLSQWLNKLELLGITYLVGKISRSNLFFSGSIGWVSSLPPQTWEGFWGYFWKAVDTVEGICVFFSKVFGVGEKNKKQL